MTFRNYAILLSVVACGACWSAGRAGAGTGRVGGTLTDRVTGRLAEGVVVVRGTPLGMDAVRGRYLLGGVPAGMREVAVERCGRSTPPRRVRVRAGGLTRLDFALDSVWCVGAGRM